jgi:hypothetical protein
MGHLAEPFDASLKNVIGSEVALWRSAEPDAGRRSREDEITWIQRDHLGEVGEEARNREDQVRGPTLLHHVAVQPARYGEVVRVRQLIQRNHPRPDRAEAWM